MTDYNAPVKDMQFIFDELCDFEGLNGLPVFSDVTPDLVDHILNESLDLTERARPIHALRPFRRLFRVQVFRRLFRPRRSCSGATCWSWG